MESQSTKAGAEYLNAFPANKVKTNERGGAALAGRPDSFSTPEDTAGFTRIRSLCRWPHLRVMNGEGETRNVDIYRNVWTFVMHARTHARTQAQTQK